MAENPFDLMPYLCMRQIFEYLGARDLAACRATCRLFKLYADQTEVRSLVVNDMARVNDRNWYSTKIPIDFNGAISLKKFTVLKSSTFQLDQHLKFLHIDTNWLLARQLDFVLLNRFSQLVHLELYLEITEGDRTLALPQLRVLKLRFTISCTLKTPKLQVLSCHNIRELRFEYPESIKWIESKYPGATFMGRFLNLEMLKYPNQIFDLDPDLLSSCKNLKELDLHNLRLNGPFNLSLRSALLNILRQRKILRREEMKCYLDDVQLIDGSQLDDYGTMKETFYFHLKHYRLIRPGYRHPYVVEINYNSLMNWTPDLSDDFFEKFPSVEVLEATGEVDRERFEWFLKNLRSLHTLRLSNTSLGQEFMDKLPNLVSGELTDLKINEELPTNFNFILCFQMLSKFEAVQPFGGSFDLAAKAFQLPLFGQFKFREGDEYVEIRKGTSVWGVRSRRTSSRRAYDDFGDYALEIFRWENDRMGKRTYFRKNLKWDRLIYLWTRRKTGKASRGRKRFKAGP